MKNTAEPSIDQRVLVLAPAATDAALFGSIIAEAHFVQRICHDVKELCHELPIGVGAVLLTDEALKDQDDSPLVAAIGQMPVWADIPVILVTNADTDSPAARRAMATFKNVTILDRPIRALRLTCALRTALKVRQRQYELRDQLQAQALLAAVVESSDDAIVTKTLDGIVTSWNTGAERIFGYSAAEAIGQHITLIIPPELHHEEQEYLARLRQGQRIEHFEAVRVTKSGRRIDISLTISPIRDITNRVIGASKVARDITARKQAQEILTQSERRFRFLAEALPSIVWTADPKGMITYANRRWLDYCGLTAKQNASDWPELVLHPDDRERCVKLWERALRDGAPYEIEVRNRRRDGVYRWFITRAVPLKDAKDRVMSWFGVTTDIHEQKELQEKLREADRRKDTFLATLAHELRNPLAPIRNGLYLLPRVREDVAAFEDTRRMMETQLRHMVHLLDDLLDISRIARNKIQLRKQRIDLAWIVNDAVEATRPLLEERNHQLTVRLPEASVALDGDSVRLAQVLSNLLNNAAKYTEPGGQISLTAEVQAGADGAREVVIRVRDTGVGIQPDFLPCLFDFFVQADNSGSSSSGGLGLGLSLVKSLVEMHGGRVQAFSEGLDKGSEFAVVLPALPESVAVSPGPSESVPVGAAPTRILVVDDNRASADSMAMVLRTFGHEVRVAYDGPQALEAVRDFRPSAALLDLGLPGMSGLELARRLRETADSRAMTLIAMTGWGRDEDRQRSHAAGFDAHLVKPVKMSTVDQLLATHSERQGEFQLANGPVSA